MAQPSSAARPETAQTLDRGLRLLHLVADATNGVTVTEAASQLGVGRAVIYRLVGTLAEHGLVRRDKAGRLRLGAGVLQLARRAQPLIAAAALPALRRLAEAAGATAHLTVAEGTEAVALLVVEPTWTQFHVAYRVGSRHRLDRGAAGRAILAGRNITASLAAGAPRAGESIDARLDASVDASAGVPLDVPLDVLVEVPLDVPLDAPVVVSEGELQPGAHGVAVPILGVEGMEASVGIVALAPLPPTAGLLVRQAATAIAAALN